jgi:D-amino peptidase
MEVLKVFVSVDLEGLAGIPSWSLWQKDSDFARRIMVAHLSPVVDSVVRAGGFVRVADSHAYGENIRLTDFGGGVELVQGFPRPDYMLSGLEAGFDTVFFVGYHTRAGGGGAMDHTYSSSAVFEVRVNGNVVGETTLNAAYAGEFGVPVSLVVGQQELEEEIRQFLPWVKLVPVQRAVSRFAAVYPNLEEVSGRIEEAVADILERSDLGEVFTFERPVKVEIVWRSSLPAQVVSGMPMFELVDGRTTVFEAPDWKTGYVWFNTAVLLGGLVERMQR